MTESKNCPNCGTPLAADAPNAPCPACLMKLGMDSWVKQNTIEPTIESPLAGGSFVPPSPEELSDRFPQFEMLSLLGAGGMGAVYQARQKSLDRLVAIKIIKPDAADVSAFADRFKREAHSLARLNHAHIIAVYDFGQTEDGLFYLVMEYVDGTNLRRLIESEEMPPERAVEIIPQICEALQFAHDEGIVHRDIKPENILVDSRGRVKIADFGLAKIVESEGPDYAITGTHQVMGTPRYMAPEQMEGAKAVDHRADIYSLGVVFYELLTGELPLGRFDPPSRKGQVDAAWDQVIMRTLEKEPSRRFQSASDVKLEVQRISDLDRPAVRQVAADPIEQPFVSAPLADEAETTPDYGALALGVVMCLVGVTTFAYGFWAGPVGPNNVWFWTAIGLTIGGGGILSAAFQEEKRLPVGTKVRPGELILGSVMMLVGAASLLIGVSQGPTNPGNVWIWIFIGLTLGGGGCLGGAWKQPKAPATDLPPGKPPQKVTDAPFTANLVIAWIGFAILHGVVSAFSIHAANQGVSVALWLLWNAVTPTMICGLVVWGGERRRGVRYPAHPGEWFWNMQGLSGATFLLLQTPVFIMQILERTGVLETGRATYTASYGVLITCTVLHIAMSAVAVFFMREWRWRFYVMTFAAGMVARVVAYGLLIAAMWAEPQRPFEVGAGIANIFCVLPLFPLLLAITGDAVEGTRRPWTHWIGTSLQIALHVFTLLYVIMAFV